MWRWAAHAEIDGGEAPGVTIEENEENRRLREDAILKAATTFFGELDLCNGGWSPSSTSSVYLTVLTERVEGCIAGHRAEIRPSRRRQQRHVRVRRAPPIPVVSPRGSSDPLLGPCRDPFRDRLGGLDVQEVTDVGDDLQRVRGGEPMSVVDLRGEDAAVVGTVELQQGHRDRGACKTAVTRYTRLR
ncbi:hypothetical protein ABZ912_22685 [Nonomuraea angiospora]|uniref:hypothetical protein n=1 Tax=Nonomuraea angiospora TaxID=46172 RepID=UPI0033F0C983